MASGWRGCARRCGCGRCACGALPLPHGAAALAYFWVLVRGAASNRALEHGSGACIQAREGFLTRGPPPPPHTHRNHRHQGLLNNSAYVICLALATEISSGGVGLVYFAAIAPTIAVKATVPLVRAWHRHRAAPFSPGTAKPALRGGQP